MVVVGIFICLFVYNACMLFRNIFIIQIYISFYLVPVAGSIIICFFHSRMEAAVALEMLPRPLVNFVLRSFS